MSRRLQLSAHDLAKVGFPFKGFIGVVWVYIGFRDSGYRVSQN